MLYEEIVFQDLCGAILAMWRQNVEILVLNLEVNKATIDVWGFVWDEILKLKVKKQCYPAQLLGENLFFKSV